MATSQFHSLEDMLIDQNHLDHADLTRRVDNLADNMHTVKTLLGIAALNPEVVRAAVFAGQPQ